MINDYAHHSPSSLNLFAACPSMWIVEKIMGIKQPVGAVAHRGVAVEEGVVAGLKNPDKPVKDCIRIACTRYDVLTIMSGDARVEKYRGDIAGMVTMALIDLRPYGVPTTTQEFIKWHPDGLKFPIIGYSDFKWADRGIIIDLKTTDRMPSEIKIGHARQVALYTSDNHKGLLTYCTPKRCETKQLENIREHRQALFSIARIVENILSMSDDPQFFLKMYAPDLDSFYWGSPAARQLAYEHWKI